jgi:hypothetical protein
VDSVSPHPEKLKKKKKLKTITTEKEISGCWGINSCDNIGPREIK